MKVLNYPPEYIEAWKLAARQTVGPIQLPTIGKARHLRQRLYKLRDCMRDEGHPNTPLAETAQVIIQKLPDGTAELLMRPADAGYAEAFRQAGVKVSEPTAAQAPRPTTPHPEPYAPSAIARALKSDED